MSVTMTLGGVSLGTDFPVYSQGFEYIRPDPQGPAYKRVKITLAGFLESSDVHSVMYLYTQLRILAAGGDTEFTYIHDGITLHNGQKVWIESYEEPSDEEFAKVASGDYSISLYYFADAPELNKAIACTYGTFTFDKTPKWGRIIKPNRESPRARLRGSTATITLSGFLFGGSRTDTQAQIEALQSAFETDQLLTYGDFSQSVKVADCSIDPVVPNNTASYNITLEYYLGAIIEFHAKARFSRLHYNPVITEEPGCNRRLVELMNASGQFITYSFDIKADTITNARTLLATEAAAIIEPGGIEMQGGEEEWNIEQPEVSINFTKFYNVPVMANLPGTDV